MTETFNLSEFVVPGTFVQVRAEGLIGVGGLSTGNIGIVGTAELGGGETHLVSDYASAQALFGAYDPLSDGTLNLTRGLEQLFRGGARTVFARALPAAANRAAFEAELAELVKDDINILVLPELSTADALAALGPVLESGENNGRDMVAIIGSDAANDAAATAIRDQAPTNDRVVMTTPGYRAFDAAAGEEVDLPGTYGAAAVAGLISTLAVQSSPTNKSLPGITKLSRRFSYAELESLLANDDDHGAVLTLEERGGVRVVRGVTTDVGAFSQITTRRIVDLAKRGARAAADPFIGKLNNARVRAALHSTIAGFFDTMVADEALTDYRLEVTASRQDEIAGRAIVNALLQPTFSIDFVAVTLTLQ